MLLSPPRPPLRGRGGCNVPQPKRAARASLTDKVDVTWPGVGAARGARSVPRLVLDEREHAAGERQLVLECRAVRVDRGEQSVQTWIEVGDPCRPALRRGR